MDELLNPWSVHSIYDFSYYFCPECESKWQFKQGKLKLLKGIDNKNVKRFTRKQNCRFLYSALPNATFGSGKNSRYQNSHYQNWAKIAKKLH